MKKVIEIRQYFDGGPNDRGTVWGYMPFKDEYMRKATEEDKTWGDKVVTEKYKEDFEQKFNEDYNGFLSSRVIDKDIYYERKEELEEELSKYDLE